MGHPLNERVAEHQPWVVATARKYVGWNGAELDDLVQEGLIAVWQTLERGHLPSGLVIEGRMKNWVRFLETQTPGDYDNMLPLEYFEDSYHQLATLAE